MNNTHFRVDIRGWTFCVSWLLISIRVWGLCRISWSRSFHNLQRDERFKLHTFCFYTIGKRSSFPFIAMIILSIFFVYFMYKLAGRQPSLGQTQSQNEVKPHIAFKIVGYLLMLLSLLNLLKSSSVEGLCVSLHLVGMGLYFFNFKSSSLSFILKFVKAIGISLLFILSNSIVRGLHDISLVSR